LYKKGELQPVDEPWEIAECFVNPSCTDPERRIDVREAAVQVASDVDKLIAQTITSMGQLIKFCPLIIDCLNLDQK
jgi:hypothetical protein